MVVQTDPPRKPRRPCNIKQKRGRRIELEEGLESSRWFYDPLGTWPSFAGEKPWMHSWSDVSVEEHGPGTRDVACGPSLCINHRCRPGYLWIDRSSVQEEFVVCSSAVPPVALSPVVRPVVVSWLGSDVALVASGSGGPVSCRPTSIEVNHPHVDLALNSVPGGLGHWKKEFDDVLVWFYTYLGNGT